MTLTSRYPTFLYEALKLQESDIPIDLDSSIIQAMIDAYQNGWALANYNFRSFSRGLQVIPQTVVLIGSGTFPPQPSGQPGEPVQKKVLGLHLEPNLTQSVDMSLRVRRIVQPTNELQDIIYRNFAVTGNSTPDILDWISDFNTGSREWWIPPDFQLDLEIGDGLVGDSIIVNVLWAQIPAGFNVGI